ENRLKEARKLGFTSAILPSDDKTGGQSGLSLTRMGDLTAFVGDVFGAG
ncbi:MAG TPA: DNA repair protein RadA, partial [Roseovarius sp.]|nr:DNA repair protein RadA [Roseovarius sp.]